MFSSLIKHSNNDFEGAILKKAFIDTLWALLFLATMTFSGGFYIGLGGLGPWCGRLVLYFQEWKRSQQRPSGQTASTTTLENKNQNNGQIWEHGLFVYALLLAALICFEFLMPDHPIRWKLVICLMIWEVLVIGGFVRGLLGIRQRERER